MRYLKPYNEAVTSSSYYNDKKFVNELESDIEYIFIDVLDDYEYDIDFHLTDYAGNISGIRLQCKDRHNPVPIPLFFQAIEHLNNYIKEHGSYLHDFNINGKWISSDTKFSRLTLDVIKKFLFERNSVIYTVSISLGPFKNKETGPYW